MRVAIVDDNSKDRAELRNCLLKWAGNSGSLKILEYQSGTEFIRNYSQNEPALVFMDIYMDGENGLAVIEQLRQITFDCTTIFVTSSRDDALQAFSLHPFDYVVKPWNEETIFRVMDDVAALRLNTGSFVEFTVGRQKMRLPVAKIGYVISDNHHVKIVTMTGEVIKSFSRFSEVSSSLVQNRSFLSCNRGIVVNMDYIEKSTETSFIMKNGDKLPLKVKDIPALQKAFAEYIFTRMRKW